MRVSLAHGRVAGLVALVLLLGSPAAAQTLGTRAAGLAEAFVAVADDATSVYWNPAGMATGALVSVVVDFGAGETAPEAPGGPRPSTRARFIGLTVPALGLSYYHQARRNLPDPEEMQGSSREDGRPGVRELRASTAGVTVAQSIADYLVVAGTIKLMRGEVRQLDASAAQTTTRLDVDAGAMFALSQWRVGLAARNLTRPEFEAPAPGVAGWTLDREVRAGAAWGSGWPGRSRVVVSTDADLASRMTASGERRDVAAGVETWWLGHRLGVRGGVRGSALGDTRAVAAAGVSVALREGAYLETHVTAGERRERAWSIGARFTF